MWSVENSVGRLIEAQLVPLLGPSEMREFVTAVADTVALAGRPIVGITDMSRVRVFAPADADLLIDVMRRDNPLVERAAIIINGDALLGMQIERLVREAQSPSRRVFCFAAQAANWVAECLAPEEAERARRFASGLCCISRAPKAKARPSISPA